MARLVMKVCDFDSCEASSSNDGFTRAINLGGLWYQFELCDKHYQEMYSDMFEFMRNYGRSSKYQPRSLPVTKPKAKEQTKELNWKNLPRKRAPSTPKICKDCGKSFRGAGMQSHRKSAHTERGRNEPAGQT